MTRQVKYLIHNACSVSGISVSSTAKQANTPIRTKFSLQGWGGQDGLMLSALGSCFSRTIQTPFLVVIVSFFRGLFKSQLTPLPYILKAHLSKCLLFGYLQLCIAFLILFWKQLRWLMATLLNFTSLILTRKPYVQIRKKPDCILCLTRNENFLFNQRDALGGDKNKFMDNCFTCF